MTQRSDIPHIRDMRLFARKTLSFVEGMTFSQFEQSDLHQQATIKTIETIGEAATEVSPAFQKSHPEIDWPQIIGMRNRLVHGYRSIDWDVVWRTIQEDLPALIARLEPMLPEQEA